MTIISTRAMLIIRNFVFGPGLEFFKENFLRVGDFEGWRFCIKEAFLFAIPKLEIKFTFNIVLGFSFSSRNSSDFLSSYLFSLPRI